MSPALQVVSLPLSHQELPCNDSCCLSSRPFCSDAVLGTRGLTVELTNLIHLGPLCPYLPNLLPLGQARTPVAWDCLATLQHLFFPDALGSPPYHSTYPHETSECPSSRTPTDMPSPNPVTCPSCDDLPVMGELFIEEQTAEQRIPSLDPCHTCTGALAAFGLG